LRGEMLVEVNCKSCVDLAFRNDGMAEQTADNFAPQPVFRGKVVAAHGRESALANRLFPRWQLAKILCVGVLKSADSRHAHTVKIGAGFRGIALEISMQRAVGLRRGQLVVRFCEM